MKRIEEELNGKVLLVLGASADEISLVQRAQKYGVYVIVTDYNTDINISPAKLLADEYWNISWSDIDALIEKIGDRKIDGVIAGYSEFRVENTIKLCRELGLPCYCDEEQLEFTRNKRKFKDSCKANAVPVIKDYSSIEEVDSFPVIVKPVDRAGSIGISIAHNRKELVKAYEYAMNLSVCKDVIIEKYVTNGKKFDAYYEIVNGEVLLCSSDDVINASNNGDSKVVQSGWILPSRHHSAYMSKVHPNMVNLITNLGIKYGYIFFSGFVDETENFVFFECGFRLCGGHLYNYFPLIGCYDNLDLFLVYQLTGSTDILSKNNVNNKDLTCLTLNVYAQAGTVKNIKGFDVIKKNKDCCFSLQQGRIGQDCKDDSAILTKIGIVYFCSEDYDELIKDAKVFYDELVVCDLDGNDMIYDKVSQDTLLEYFKEKELNENE